MGLARFEHGPRYPVAYWSIALIVDCPKCKKPIDIFARDIDLVYEVQIGEHDTPKTEGYDAICPYCDYEFPCDFQY